MENTSTQLIFSLLDSAARIERRLERHITNNSGISFTEYRILKALQQKHNGATTRVDLASAVNLTASAITRALKPLEKIGYVETQKSDRDARQSLAALTSSATTLLVNADKMISDEIDSLSVPQDNIEQMMDYFDRLGSK